MLIEPEQCRMLKPTIEIDGSRFDTLNDSWEEISVSLIPGTKWGRNFDAFNDILRGGFGTPRGGFRLRWVNFRRSSETLGYPETIRWLENKLERCHPGNFDFVKREIEAARGGKGPTVGYNH